jgi:hypothetical protein
MTDLSLDEEAKKLLDALAQALSGITSQNDGKGNLKYELKEVSPFVKPLLKTVGLPVWLEFSVVCDLLILFSGLEFHSMDVEHIFQMEEVTRPRQHYTYLQYIGFGEKRAGRCF